jgi:DNA modification methylase
VTDWQIHLGDCITGMGELEPESVDLTVTSIPFGALFMYSGKNEDIGNNEDGTDLARSFFGAHLRFWAEALFRVTKPGTLVAIHIQQLITYKVQHGYMGRRDLRGATVDVLNAAGFDWWAEYTIPKNPQVIAQRQKLNSLLFATGYRDGRSLAPAVNDHCLVFKRPGEAEAVPCLFHESKNPDGWVSTDEWIRWARGTWDDVRETDVLEGWQMGRDEDDEKHVCPLQLDVIRRCVKLWTNPGDLVFDPFTGIGSTPYVAVEEGRQGLGFELKESYHRQACKNLEKVATGGSAQMTIEEAMAA